MLQRRTLLTRASALVAGPSLALPALGQPAGTAVIWSGFPAGGLADQVTRPLIDRLRGKYPATFVLDGKPGAGARIAVDFVKRANADGNTLLQTPSSPMTLYPHLYKKLSYDPLADFAAVTPLVEYCFSFTAGPGLPAEVKSVADVLAWAKANPTQANYGIPAAGSALHFAGMLLTRASGLDLKSVPYRGGGPLLQDLLGGQVPVASMSSARWRRMSRPAACAHWLSPAPSAGQGWSRCPPLPSWASRTLSSPNGWAGLHRPAPPPSWWRA